MGDDMTVDTEPSRPAILRPAVRAVRGNVRRWRHSPRRSTTRCLTPGPMTYVRASAVRAPLHGRSVRGWVVEADASAPKDVELLPAQVLARLGAAAGRRRGHGAGRVAVRRPAVVFCSRLPGCRRPCVAGAAALPAPSPTAPGGPRRRARMGERMDGGQGVTMARLPPTTDVIDLVVAVLGQAPRHEGGGGSAPALVPSTGWAERLTTRLERRGYPVARSLGGGTRWMARRRREPGCRMGAGAGRLAAAIVLDVHDAAYRQEICTHLQRGRRRHRARPARRGPARAGVPDPAGVACG